MKMQIFALRCGASGKSAVREYVREIPDFDVSRMWQGYYAGKPAMRRSFEKFAADWQESLHALAKPQAGVMVWDKGDLMERFVSRFPEGGVKRNIEERCSAGYAAVWTIGGELEEKSCALAAESAMQGMFLDIAGTLTLTSMRAEIKKFLASDEFAESAGKELLGEYIPEVCGKDGVKDARLALIAEPWMEVCSLRRPNFAFHKSGLMSPLKTQCSMFFTGTGRGGRSIAFNTVPCSNCMGSKCLAAQFNGCHLPEENQPWLRGRVE